MAPLKIAAMLLLADAQDPDEELVALAALKLAKQERQSNKFGHRGPYDRSKSTDFLHLIIYEYSSRWFEAWMRYGVCVFWVPTMLILYRMSRASFWHLHDIIAGDSIFVSKGRRPQRPVSIQLAAFLIKYGSLSMTKTAGVVSIAEGTVHLYCSRVCRALRNVRDQHLSWPGQRRRAFLKEEMAKWGFPGCIGIVDGTLIQLMDKPLKNGWAYYCWKKFYAVCIHLVSWPFVCRQQCLVYGSGNL